MILQHTPGRLLLFIVDCCVLFVALYTALLIRTGEAFTLGEFLAYIPPFTLVILVSVSIFYSYGLYDKPSLRLIRELSNRIFTSQILTALSAVLLFYTLPVLGIAPKTILFIYIALSSLLMIIWRKYAFSLVLRYKKHNSVLIGSGETYHLLIDELSRNPHTGITLIATIDVDSYPMDTIGKALVNTKPNSIIIDMKDERIKPHLGALYSEFFSGCAVLDIIDVYEDVFDMVPTSLINQEWVFRCISTSRRYDGVKRFFDVLLAIPSGILSLTVFPFIYLAIKLEDGGPIFYTHKRIGRYGKSFDVYKFRSMENLPTNEKHEIKQVTKVGLFLRKTRLDELPQLWNVIKGDVSLVGPRPEAPSLVDEYIKTVPFYNVRHVVRPGLSGWAQIQQHIAPKFGVDVKQTEIKLAYDLYYLEHSSFILDFAIILKTFKVLLSKSGQ